MRMVPCRLLAVCAIIAIVPLALTACAPSKPSTTRTASASSSPTPAFDSDEAALKAATAAYAAYLKMSDTIAQEGGANPERIKPFATGEALATSLKSAKQFRDANAHSTGSTTFDNVKLQGTRYSGRNRVVVTFYACDDLSGVDVLDGSGKSITSPDRPDSSAFEIDVAGAGRELAVDGKRPWTGPGVCE
jgi:hypothetical protein